MAKKRLDVLLVERGLMESRQKAQAVIMAGQVYSGERRLDKAGLALEEGYKAITIHPAMICGVADRVGSLEVGKDADIAVFTGNPMEVFTRTLYTIIDGEIAYEADKAEEAV